MAKTKSKLRQEQEEPMAVVPVRMTLAHERWARRQGGGNTSAHVRQLIEDDMRGFVEKRHGAPDRRRKK